MNSVEVLEVEKEFQRGEGVSPLWGGGRVKGEGGSPSAEVLEVEKEFWKRDKFGRQYVLSTTKGILIF